MALQAIVEDGKIVNDGTATSVSDRLKQEGTANAVDEDMFLKLLVAEMQYQDPLQPTSNTEWVSQYATFTQVQQMTTVQQSVQQSQASDLVGKQVIMRYTDSTGETKYESGKVDYMYVEGGKTYLWVNEKMFSIDELDTVVDEEYLDAVTIVQTFEAIMSKMPSEKALALADENLVKVAREAYDSMTDYQKSKVSKELVDTLKALEKKMEEMIKTAQGTEGTMQAFEARMSELPKLADLELKDEEALISARKAYNALSADDKKKVEEETLTKLAALEEKMEALKKAAEDSEGTDGGTE